MVVHQPKPSGSPLEVHRPGGASATIVAAALGHDGHFAAAVDARGGLHVLQLPTGTSCLALSEGPPGGALCFARAARDEIIYSAVNKLRVVDAATRQLVASPTGHAEAVHAAVAVGALALTHSRDALLIWRVADWSRLRALLSPSSPVVSASLGGTAGDALGVLYEDARVALWAAESGEGRAELRAPKVDGKTLALRHLAVGRRCAVSAASDGQQGLLVLWPLHTSELIKGRGPDAEIVLDTKSGPVMQLAMRDMRIDESAKLAEDVIFVAHTSSVCMVGAETQRVLLSIVAPQLTLFGLDDFGQRVVLLSGLGQLEWRDLTSERRALRPRRGSSPASVSRSQPSQGFRRLHKISASRIDVACQRPQLAAAIGVAEKSVSLTRGASAVNTGRGNQSADSWNSPRRKLLGLLRKHGCFPKHQRSTVWQCLLQLPKNENAHAGLLSCGVKHRFREMLTRFESLAEPVRSRLERLLSALLSWNLSLGELPYLVSIAMPFSQVFAPNEPLAFEACASFFLTWGFPWLAYFPSPPLDHLTHARELLAEVDVELLAHLEACAAPDSQVAVDLREFVVWPMVQTALSECLENEAWLALWDHLVARWQEPWHLNIAVVAVLRCLRLSLLASRGPLEVLRQPQAVPAAELVREFLALRRRVPEGGPGPRPREALPDEPPMLPLPAGSAYPPLLDGLHPVLEYHAQDRARARHLLEDAQRVASTISKARGAIEVYAVEEAAVRAAQAKILRAEEARRALAKDDEEQLEAQWQRCLHAALAKQMDRVELACATAAESMSMQHALHESEATRKADEAQQRRRRLILETEAEEQRLEVLGLEAKASQHLASVVNQRRSDDAARDLRKDVQATLLQMDHDDDFEWRRRREEDQADRLEMRSRVEQQIEAAQVEAFKLQRREVEEHVAAEGVARQLQLGQVEHARSVRLAARDAAIEADRTLEVSRQCAEAAAARAAARREELIVGARYRHQERLASRQRAVTDAATSIEKRITRRAQQLQAAELAEEYVQFEARVQQAVADDNNQGSVDDERLKGALHQLERIHDEERASDRVAIRASLDGERQLLAHREEQLLCAESKVALAMQGHSAGTGKKHKGAPRFYSACGRYSYSETESTGAYMPSQVVVDAPQPLETQGCSSRQFPGRSASRPWEPDTLQTSAALPRGVRAQQVASRSTHYVPVAPALLAEWSSSSCSTPLPEGTIAIEDNSRALDLATPPALPSGGWISSPSSGSPPEAYPLV